MQVAVSPGEAALREMVTRESSEGHCFGLRPLNTGEGSTCRTKGQGTGDRFRQGPEVIDPVMVGLGVHSMARGSRQGGKHSASA